MRNNAGQRKLQSAVITAIVMHARREVHSPPRDLVKPEVHSQLSLRALGAHDM